MSTNIRKLPDLPHPSIFSGAMLKWIAIASMAIDHLAASVLQTVIMTQQIQGADASSLFDAYSAMRRIGRIAFPIYCFMIVEGFTHTHSRQKYLCNLILFACISEIPFDLAFSQEIFDPMSQNVYFTLALGLISIWALDEITKRMRGVPRMLVCILLVVAVYAAGDFAEIDYGGYGPLAIIILYETKDNRLLQCIAGAVIFAIIPGEFPFALISFILLYCYSGLRGRQSKWFFYSFYPAHLLIFGIISTVLVHSAGS